MHKAAEEVYFLLNRGYPVTSTTRFIGDHYQLSERQRLALARTIDLALCGVFSFIRKK
ncbi:DUF434 domain-containing protein [Ruminococcus albus]|uniref:DUF434 domain-containing protein n=1 Tax=Ruminococcus albus TaxID=1264 RepID=UPI0009B5E7B8|nr:DUF434 domain-containing protein [Ruminococcus albus]